ncbi:Panacea domain-containing protein [Acidobacteria bacterium AH-259-A15]|nr:Panacea domain-containing protein [Acidobacteria bacterium AH-259-A15]
MSRLIEIGRVSTYNKSHPEQNMKLFWRSQDDPELDPKLEAVLARLCERRGPLFKTQAVKLPYLVDVVATHVIGKPITEGSHETWEHGVVTKEVFMFMKHSSSTKPFKITPHEYSEGGQKIEFDGPALSILTEEETEIVDFVADHYGNLSPEQLGILTKALNTEFTPEEWGENGRALVDENAYARLSEGWQDFYRCLPGLDLDDESQWGDPIEDDPLKHLRQALDA